MVNTLTNIQKKKFKPVTAIKIVLDVILAIVFILLMDAKVISMEFHEIAGLAIGGVFLIHKLLNWKWIKNVTKSIFGRQVTAETRIRYIVDILLFVGVYMIIITGALISEYVFPGASGGGDWTVIHKTLAYICIPLVGIHAGLHVKWMKSAFRKMLKITKNSKVRQWALRTASMALAIWGIVGSVTSGFFGKMIIIGGQESGGDSNNLSLADSADGTETSQGSTSTANSSTSGSTSTDADSQTSGTTDSTDSATSSSQSSSSSDNGTSITESDDEGTTAVSLETFLSSLNCTACHKNCSLLSPRCGKGRQQQQEATAEYESLYGSTGTVESVVYSDDTGSYLQVGTAVYTLTESSASTQSVVTLSYDTDQSGETTDGDSTESSLEGPGGGGGERIGGGGGGPEGGEDQSGKGIWSTILTYAPIMWLFGVVGWAISLLSGRKRKATGIESDNG